MAPRWAPERGEIVWLRFSPQAGREQAGHRPALVLSPAPYNRATGLMICCPLTSQQKGYPFEVALHDAGETPSVALADHVRSVDWCARGAKLKGRASAEAIDEVLGKLTVLLR